MRPCTLVLPDYREGGPDAANALREKGPPAFVRDLEVRPGVSPPRMRACFSKTFSQGDKSKVGRFYWLGLGAFASKQVAATLALWQADYTARWS